VRALSLLVLPFALPIACAVKTPDWGGDTGAADGGSGDDSGAPLDTGIAVPGYRGQATVGADYQGTEEFYYLGLVEKTEVCVVESQLRAAAPSALLCEGCEWSFDVVSSDSVVTTDTYCGGLDAAIFDGSAFTYAYHPDYYGAPALMYYSATAATWYGLTSDVSLDGSQFTYDWLLAGYYYGYYR
jgi:hypothetical protein